MKHIFDKLQKLNDAGYTDAFIGRLLGIPQPTIFRMRKHHYKTISYERGTAILNLAKNLLREQKDNKQDLEKNP